MLKPLHKNVILKKEKVAKEVKTASGIILTENNKQEPSYAHVVAIGPECETDIKVDDKVVYKAYSGTDVKLDEEEYIIIADEDTLAVLDQEDDKNE